MSINPVAAASIIMLVLLFLKVPVFASVFAAAAAYFFLMPDLPQQIVVQRMLAGAESIPMLAIPFFVCAGTFMNYSGVTARVMQFCEMCIRDSTHSWPRIFPKRSSRGRCRTR